MAKVAMAGKLKFEHAEIVIKKDIYILSITTEYTIADHIKTDHMGFHSDMNSLIF